MSRPRYSPTRRAALAALAMGLVTTLAACASSDPADGPARETDDNQLSDVTLILGQNNFDLEPKLKASGVLAGAPYQVKFSSFSNVADVATALGSGAIDYAGSSPIAAIQAQASAVPLWTATDLPYKAIWLTAPVDPTASEFVQLVSAKSGITEFTADQIRGKRWSTPPGGNTELNQLLALKSLGLTRDDIESVSLTHAQAAAALSTGDIDIASAVIGNFGEVIANHSATIIARGAEYGGDIPSGGYATTTAISDSAKSAALGDLLKRLMQANLWWAEHPAEAQQALVDTQKLSPEAAELSWFYTRQTVIPIDDAQAAAIQNEADVLFEAGSIKTKVDVGLTLDRQYSDLIQTTAGELDLTNRLAAAVAKVPAK